MNKFFVFILFAFACSTSAGDKSPLPAPLYVSMANSELLRNPDPRLIDFREKPKWEYTNGLMCTAFLKVWQATGDDKYLDYVKFYADSMIHANGNIKTYKLRDYNIDRVNPGKFLMELYKIDPQPKYRYAIDTLREQMRHHPRTKEGGFWHKKRYTHQMWLDGLYMGSPFLAQYAAEYNEPALFDDVANQIYLIDKYTWNTEKNFFHHGWDESREQKWANPDTGRSPHCWGRAMGWFAMALVDVLDYFPAKHEKRNEILIVLRKMANSIVSYQDEASGLWWQVIDQGAREGNYLEASCSSMFSYFLLKSIEKGYLPKEKYYPSAKRGYEGIVNQLVKENTDGSVSLTEVCGVAGLGGNPYRDASYEYYVNEIKRDNDPKGVGPLIMASLYFENLNLYK